MRLKSKSVTLVALLVLTAMPRALDQLSELGNMAEERFRTELLNIFWSLTAPETHRDGPKQYSELLARAATGAPRCERSVEARATRPARAFNSLAPATQPTALEHLQPWGTPVTPAADSIAEALPAPAWVWEIPAAAAEHAPAAHQMSAQPDKQQDAKVVLVAENQKGHVLLDEAALPAQVEDAIAELDLNQDETTEATAVPAVKSEARAERFGQKFVETNFQFRLPENLGPLPGEKFGNSSTLIKVRDAFQQAKPKCRVRVIRLAPDTAPALAARPATIS